MPQAKQLVEKYFGSWQKANVINTAWKAAAGPSKTNVTIVDRANSVQSVINVTYPLAVQQRDKDFLALQLANNILGGGSSGLLFQNLREKKAYTYGAYSSVTPDKVIGSFSAGTSVRKQVTDSAVIEILKEMKFMAEQGASKENLDAAKAILAGSFGLSLEQPATIVRFAMNIGILGLPKEYYRNYLKNLDAVTLQQVNEAAKTYIRPQNVNVIIVGDAEATKAGMTAIGDVRIY